MLRLGLLTLSPPFGLAPMAGLTDSAFRRLVKRLGGCSLVVTEMVSAEGLVRGHGRTLEYAEFTEEERPLAIQVFGGDPDHMAEAARIVEGIGADIVDVNMGCPVPKIAKGHAGCRLMREPEQAVAIVSAMVGAVKIPVTVKMRSGWDDKQVVAPEFAARMEGAGAAAVTVHGRTGAQAFRGSSDWDVIARVARAVKIPVFGNGDCVEAGQVVDRWHESGVAGVLVGRGVVRNPWMLAQAADVAAGRAPRAVEAADRARFLLDYIELLMGEPDSEPGGFRHAPSHEGREHRPAGGHRRTTRSRAASTARDRERWVIGKVRALAAWYTKGLEGGAEFRATINRADSIDRVRESLRRLFGGAPGASHGGEVTADADLRV